MARILYIEDDAKSRLLVRKLLASSGHEVVEAESGLAGIRAASVEKPDLVLVDINIPDLDGYEVTLRLRGMPGLAGVPIVAVTAEGDRSASLAVGADGFIAKPIDPARFPGSVEKYLRGHREKASKESGEHHLRTRSHKIVERLEQKVGELSTANAQLEEMMRLRREFLRNLSHELATPMTPVVGYLKLLLAGELGPVTPLQRKSLLEVEAATHRLRSVVDTLLDVSALETGRMQFYERTYDFTEVAARAVQEVRPKIAELGLTLIEEPAPAGLVGRGDSDKLRRAMVHVLDNASKFTPRGGEVAAAVRRGSGTNGTWYSLIVGDSGPGVPKDQLAKILEPFYQVDGSVTRQHGGVGLGLAFARRVTEAMGGGIEIQSPPREEIAGRALGGTAVILRVQAQPPGMRAPTPHGGQPRS